MNNKKIKILIMAVCLVVNAVCCAVSCFYANANVLRIIGSFVAFLAVFVVTFKMPVWVFALSCLFAIIASSLGTLLGFYVTVNFYDKIVHYISGVILSIVGFFACEFVFNKRKINIDYFSKNLIAFLFSCSCAAFWEIYEFTVDAVFKMSTQGNNSNTMGDIVAGILGAVTFAVSAVLIKKLKKV